MSYFSNEYLSQQLERLESASKKRLTIDDYFVKPDRPLYALNVDVKRSTSLPIDLRGAIVGHINLLVATEIVGRNGAIVNFTDGVDAFFCDPEATIRTGMSIYHRKRQIQERVLQPIVQDYERHLSEPGLDYRDIDYRVLLVEVPLAQKNEIVSQNSANNKSAVEELIRLWREAVSRYGNRESFLISKEMYERLQAGNVTPLLKYFDKTTIVPFLPVKETVNRVAEFFRNGFYNYANPSIMHVDIEKSWSERYLGGSQMDADLQAAFYARREGYRSRQGYRTPAVADTFLFDYFKIEPMRAASKLPGAVVLGDINLDFVTYLKADDAEALTNTKSHMQLQQDIQKVVAGKGVNIAFALEETERFDSILLIGKLGMDIEMSHIVQALKGHRIIKPILFLSSSLPTGTSISIRRLGENRSLVTITDKPNANSELVVEEVQTHFSRLCRAEYLFISGYCLFDDRLKVVCALVEEFRKSAGSRIILEFSPAHLLRSYFSESEDRRSQLRKILEACFLVAYEEGAFADDGSETKLLSNVPYKLKLTGKIRAALESHYEGEWHLFMPIAVSAEGSLGLFSRVMAKYVSERFLKPRLVLCSSSPRRYELLAGLYGHSGVYHLRDLPSPEFEKTRFRSHSELVRDFLRVTLKKLRLGMRKLDEMPEGREFELCRVAMASDLVVVGGHKEGDYIVLDKPDDDNDPIGKEREILSEWLSGRIHHVWTCNCFLDFRGFVDRQGQWNHERFKAADSALGEYMETIGKSDAFEKITRGFDPTKDPKARHFWEEEIILAGQDVLKMQLLLSCSRVTFKSLSGVEIEEYLTCGEWRKKGGGYAIQGNASYFVDEIEGSFTNIVGLPMPDVDMLLRKHYEIVPQTPV